MIGESRFALIFATLFGTSIILALPRCLVCGKEQGDAQYCLNCGRDLKRHSDDGDPKPVAKPVVGRELGIRETALLALRLYRRNFWSYVALFVAVGTTTGLLTWAVQYVLPIQPSQYTSVLSGVIESPSLVLQSVVAVAVLSPITTIAQGTGVSLAVDSLEREEASLGRATISRWAASGGCGLS